MINEKKKEDFYYELIYVYRVYINFYQYKYFMEF